MTCSVSRSKSVWTRATESLHAMQFPNAERRSSTFWGLHRLRQHVPEILEFSVSGNVWNHQPVFVTHGQPAHNSCTTNGSVDNRHVLSQFCFEHTVEILRSSEWSEAICVGQS